MLSRVCTKTCVPMHNLLYNTEYWPKPKKFEPDRFNHNADVADDLFTLLPFRHVKFAIEKI